jgi:hypothetical protein
MNPEELHQHLITIADPDPGRRRSLAAAIAADLWPGGTGDRTDPAALEWLPRWRPERGAPVPPGCSCPIGRCAVCN